MVLWAWLLVVGLVFASEQNAEVLTSNSPPRIKPMPLPKGRVNYPANYEPPVFQHLMSRDELIDLIAKNMEKAQGNRDQNIHTSTQENSDDQPTPKTAEEFSALLRKFLHSNDDVDSVSEEIWKEAKKTAHKMMKEELEEEPVVAGPLTPADQLNKLQQEFSEKFKELVTKKKMAEQLTTEHQKLVMDELKKLQMALLGAADETPEMSEALNDLANEFSEAIARDVNFWNTIARNLEYRFKKEEILMRYLLKKSKMDIFVRSRDLSDKHDAAKAKQREMARSKTIRGMHNLCIFEQTSITSQLPVAFPPDSLIPVSAHPACWCEGQLRQADMMRSGMLDYYYNNYLTLRRCLSEKCTICQFVYELIWVDLEEALNPHDLCDQWSRESSLLVGMGQKDAYDNCIRLANGFIMNTYGIMSRTAEVFGEVEALKKVADCDKELEAMKKKLSLLSLEACRSMNCCQTGKILTTTEVAQVKTDFATVVDPPPGNDPPETNEPAAEAKAKINSVLKSLGSILDRFKK